MSIMRVSRFSTPITPFTLALAGSKVSARYDATYGTALYGPTNLTVGVSTALGKVLLTRTQFTDYNRMRLGLYFTIPNFTGTPNSVTLTGNYAIINNTLESCIPAFYLSNTDDSAFGTGWQNNYNTHIGDGTDPGTMMSVSFPWNNSMKGTKISLIFGLKTEILGTGGTPPLYGSSSPTSYMDVDAVPADYQFEMIFT